MTRLLHVYTDLMRASRLENTLYERYISEAFYDSIMGNCRLSDPRFRRENLHAEPILRVAGDVALYRSLLFREVSPHQCGVTAVGSLIKKLESELRLGIRRLSNEEQATRVLVDAMHQSYLRIVCIERRQVL